MTPATTAGRASGSGAAGNGIADRIAAVEAARTRLGQDIDRLTVETRAQMGQTMEKIAWRTAATGSAIAATVLTRRLMVVAWQKARSTDPPMNPAAPTTQWGEALAWTAVVGVSVGLARLLAQRGAAAGWQKATGMVPPGIEG